MDIFQPCVSFNKTNIFKWFKDNTYYLEASHDPADRVAAFKRSVETEKLPLGIFYLNENKPVFEEQIPAYGKDPTPLWKREVRGEAIVRQIQKLKT